MRVLQARFYPHQTTVDDFFVVGHVVWEKDGVTGVPVVQPSASLLGNGALATMLSKLQYLVEVNSPESFERLQTLRSRFWSFVEVAA
ncbi:MAG TPA: hypothetical protein VHJ20_10360 [Polyangia bacterium]|nr:hypothetical protein [Polyangia bacterium]